MEELQADDLVTIIGEQAIEIRLCKQMLRERDAQIENLIKKNAALTEARVADND